ncbi:hypothetical protein LTR37_002155 [Vermiconidia calcicola]|uniref:Uncharacterized protein n=1 Tax=Vermiconidia calcicola TaxID=1690605 RepID=A0ACC3NTR2_9PEZI|nr:hypothetical protein LTR37_002155 [Vermiconidia calcicola]
METDRHQRLLSRLESLPGELRNTIYGYAVVENSPVIAASLVDKQAKFWRSHQPALGFVCKQIRDEVLPMYYSENAFTFQRSSGDRGDDDLDFATAWLRSTGKHHALMQRAASEDKGSKYLHHAIAWLRSTGTHYAQVQRVGVNFTAMIKRKDGIVEREECSITATISNLGTWPIAEHHFSQNLNPPCNCPLVPINDIEKATDDPLKRLSSSVNKRDYPPLPERWIKMRRLRNLAEAMASCCEGMYEEYAKLATLKDCTNCGGRKYRKARMTHFTILVTDIVLIRTCFRHHFGMSTSKFETLFGPLPDDD